MKVFFHRYGLALVLAGVLTLVVTVAAWFAASQRQQVEFTLGTISLQDGSTIRVEIADSPDEQEQGLMGREKIDPESGMLFVFETPGQYEFWMKGTEFDLDFIWLVQGVVVDVQAQVPAGAGLPEAELARLKPQVPADAVLEVPAGFIQLHQVKRGDKLDETPSVF